MSSPVHTPRPILQPIRRSFTAPIKPPPSSVQSPAQADPSDSAAEVLFTHPTVKIVSFSPPVSTYSSAPGRLRSTSSPLANANDFDYPVDAIETLPWYSTTEKTAASGLLKIEKVRGSTCFLKCGQICQALMRNSQCWIELPFDNDDDKIKIEGLKTALNKTIRYEKTPCPFMRGFKVDLPAELRTPRKKKAWTPRKSIVDAMPDIGSRPQTAPEQNAGEIVARDKSTWVKNDDAFRENNSVGTDDSDITDESATTSGSEASTKSPSPPIEPTTPSPLKRLSKVRPVVDALEQELAKAAEAARRQSPPLRTVSSYQEQTEGQLPSILSGPQSDLSRESLEKEEEIKIAPQPVTDVELEKEPMTALKDPPLDWPLSEPILEESALEATGTPEVTDEKISQQLPAVETSAEQQDAGLASHQAPVHDVDAPSEDLGGIDKESPAVGTFLAEEVLHDNAEQQEDFDLSNLRDLPGMPANTHTSPSSPLRPHRDTVSEDSESIASSLASFHSLASLDFEDAPLTPSPPEAAAYSPFIQSPESRSQISSPEHKRGVSELTVTTLLPSYPPEAVTAETPVQSLQQTSPVYVPPVTSSPMSHWPIISSSPSTGPTAIGLRQRIPRPRRSFSPLPHPSTLLDSPQSHSSGRRIARAIIQKASSIALGKPIEMAAMLLHVLGRIASGATVADLMSGDLFRRSANGRVSDERDNSDDEDDFGIPIRGRDRSRSQSNTRQSTTGTKTPSELD